MVDESTRLRVRRIVFEADTVGGKAFDVVLLVLIVASVLLVMLESVSGLEQRYGDLFLQLELAITAVFMAEYGVRWWSAEDGPAYARSFFGVIDLLAILPVLVSFVLPGAQSLLVVRSLRLLRVFRVFKMAHWLGEANLLLGAVRSSSRKITVFLLTVLLINVVVGSTMYVIEGAENGFDNMFRGVYWSIVTMSTVGFGDITPSTGAGQVLAGALMILGYSIIAVPTGIVTSELALSRRPGVPPSTCRDCGRTEHEPDARHCATCGAALVAAAPA